MNKRKQQQIEAAVRTFLDEQQVGSRPVVVGCSGGGDSLALLFAVAKVHACVALAHVDHAWRPSSSTEAQALEQLAEELNIEFYATRLAAPPSGVNREDWWRQQRYHFFKKVCDAQSATAVLLGHHADDLAETVFKRIVEGADVTRLAAIRQVHAVDDLVIWRPLLRFSKQELADYLAAQGLTPFEDETNEDPSYHRGLLRSRLFPQIEQELKRPIRHHLAQLGRAAGELEEYLDRQIAQLLSTIVSGPLGTFFEGERLIEMVEIRHLIRRFCQIADLPLSANHLEIASRLYKEGGVGSANQLVIDRRRLFAPAQVDMPQASVALRVGEQQIGGWFVSMYEGTGEELGDWRDLYGRGVVRQLPTGNYQLGLARLDATFCRTTTLKKWYHERQIPAHLRQLIPVIWDGEKVACTFVAEQKSLGLGKLNVNSHLNSETVMIRLRAIGSTI